MGRKETKNKHNHLKTKHRTKDLDEIQNDMKDGNADRLLNQEIDHDVAGSAQYYCLHCARYFVSDIAMKDHFKTKGHKRRLKALETDAYTQEEADRAAGMGSYVAPKKRKVETQSVEESIEEDTELTEPTKKKKKK